MLRTLSIRDFVIVDSIELEFGRGFSVLTGETGAGKSILIDALTLALGGRGDASVVREGAARADISADFAAGAGARRLARGQRIRGRGRRRAAAPRDRQRRPFARLHQRQRRHRRPVARAGRAAGRHPRPACAPVAAARRCATAAAGYPGRAAAAGAGGGAGLARLAGGAAPAARIRAQCQERAGRARAARVAGRRAGKAGGQAGRMGRDQQRAQPAVACRQPDRRRAGGAEPDFRSGAAAAVATVGAEPEAGQAGRDRRRTEAGDRGAGAGLHPVAGSGVCVERLPGPGRARSGAPAHGRSAAGSDPFERAQVPRRAGRAAAGIRVAGGAVAATGQRQRPRFAARARGQAGSRLPGRSRASCRRRAPRPPQPWARR